MLNRCKHAFVYVFNLIFAGIKSDDPDSPAYTPSLFSFTEPLKRKRLELGLMRYNSAKRRRMNKCTLTSDEQSSGLPNADDHNDSHTSDEGDHTDECQQSNACTVSNECTQPVEQAHQSVDNQSDIQNEFSIPSSSEYHDQLQPEHQKTNHSDIIQLTAQLNNLQNEYQARLEEIKIMKEEKLIREEKDSNLKGFPSMQDMKSKKIRIFYTGIVSYQVLIAIFDHAVKALGPSHDSCKLDNFQCYTMTLMKLRLNLQNFDLACRFGIHETTVSRNIKKWISLLDTQLKWLIYWPDRDSIKKTMPFCYRPHYGLKVVSIIDCFELFIEKPANLHTKAITWSSYKHYNTAKYLISITPQGSISFISKGWGGRASDKQITEQSGYLRNLTHGDIVLADRGFTITDSLALVGATLDLPAFTKGCDQLSPAAVEATRKLANVRIHVERVIGAVRQRFQILSATGVLPKEYIEPYMSDGTILLDSVVRVCCALHNVCESVVPFH